MGRLGARRRSPCRWWSGTSSSARSWRSGSNVKDFHVGEIVSGEGHVVCGRCRNCLAGRRHLCKDTKGVGVNRPGAFAEYLSLPMTNVWVHDPEIDPAATCSRSSIRSATRSTRPCQFDVLGEDVLITGAGPIGIMAAAVVRHAGRAIRRRHRRESVSAGAGEEDGRDAGRRRARRRRSPTCRKNWA